MTKVVLFVLVLLALVFGYAFYRQMAVIVAMGRAVNMVKLGLFRQLKHRYLTELERPEATLLADAVTAYIFSEEPTVPHEVQFKRENVDRIEAEARRLSNDRQTCQLLTQAVRTQATIAFIRLNRNAQIATAQLERLNDLGILVAGGEAPSPDTFVPAARAFCDGDRSLDTSA